MLTSDGAQYEPTVDPGEYAWAENDKGYEPVHVLEIDVPFDESSDGVGARVEFPDGERRVVAYQHLQIEADWEISDVFPTPEGSFLYRQLHERFKRMQSDVFDVLASHGFVVPVTVEVRGGVAYARDEQRGVYLDIVDYDNPDSGDTALLYVQLVRTGNPDYMKASYLWGLDRLKELVGPQAWDLKNVNWELLKRMLDSRYVQITGDTLA
ncbi:MAG: hypothetical protein GF405_06055 [Candidatus Eisenbacteria bacterium]|nr:hypothetical protein [Candidatus Eisenbacteria bacterium]